MKIKFIIYEEKEVIVACEYCPICGEYSETIIGERDHNLTLRGTEAEQIEDSEFTNTLLKEVECNHGSTKI